MTVTLIPIDAAGRTAVLGLHVSPDQDDFVASNAESLDEADENPECFPLAIAAGGLVVGFAMYALDSDDDNYWIYRLMIDHRYQGRGFGRAALRALIARLSALAGCDAIYLGVAPENVVAAELYVGEGFAPTGEMFEGEIVMRRPVAR